jgi:hypothetical protein
MGMADKSREERNLGSAVGATVRERERGAVSAGELRLARVRERWVGSHSAGFGMGSWESRRLCEKNRKQSNRIEI